MMELPEVFPVFISFYCFSVAKIRHRRLVISMRLVRRLYRIECL